MRHLRTDCRAYQMIIAGPGLQCSNCLAVDDRNLLKAVAEKDQKTVKGLESDASAGQVIRIM